VKAGDRGAGPRAAEVRRVPRPYTLGPTSIAFGDGTESVARLSVERGKIAAVLPGDGPADFAVPDGATIAPGMIDVHTNGAEGALFNRDQGNAVDVASHAYARQGVSAYVASVMTAPWESMLHAASEIAETAFAREESHALTGARCLGVHFEGPFLSAKFRRVHRSEWLRTTSRERARELLDACRGALLMVTMAPEVDGVSDVARFFFDQGIVCAAGHTSGKYRDGVAAIGLGFRTLTHAFNGMPPLDHREPSILAAFMRDERTTVQVICDGYHVAPVMIDLLYRSVGERLVLATDYMAPAGAGYRIEGGVVRAEDGTIAGSALHCDHAVRNLMAYTGIPFSRAIINATQAPARLLGIESDCGTIAVGKRADFSIWSRDHEILATVVGGEFVHGAHHVRTIGAGVG